MKKLIILTATMMLIILSLNLVSPITASIGNSRMVLRASPGEEIERSILVKNINEVNVNIEMTVSGDLEKETILREANFSLAPGEEMQAYFTITPKKPTTTTTKINVKFIPETGPSVGLASTIIVIAGTSPNTPDEDENEENKTLSLFNFNSNENQNSSNSSSSSLIKPSISLSPIIILSISTLVLIITLVILMIIATKIKKRRRKR